MKDWKRWLILGMAAGTAVAVTAACAGAASRSAPVDPAGEALREEAAALTPRVTPAMVRYSYTRYALYFFGVSLDLAILVLFLRSGASARWRDVVEKRVRWPVLRTLVYFLGFSVAYSALLLPLTFYSGWWLPHQYNLSDQPLPAWAGDRLKEGAISLAIAAPLVQALYALLRRQPRRWWFSFWLLSIPVTIFLVLLAPVLLDPVFHKYEPLQDHRLRNQILALAAKAGIQGSHVYQVDMSRETKTINAYVTGLGATKRIVIWDTTLKRLQPDEILFITGHEMGHYVYDHVYWGVALSIGGSLVLFFLLDRLTRLLLSRRGPDWGIRDMADLAALPALALSLSVLQFLGTPVMAAVSRTMESQADQFGLRITGNGHAAARAFVKLSEDNLSLPSPPAAIHLWAGTHPTLRERIDTALEWDRDHRIRQAALVEGQQGQAPQR